MAAGKRPALPLVLTASDLLEGDVVFYADGAWSRELGDATVARDEAAATVLESVLAAAESRGIPVAAYLMTVGVGSGGAIVPDHYRERIRSLGPTVRRDLGPQARKERQHVSL